MGEGRNDESPYTAIRNHFTLTQRVLLTKITDTSCEVIADQCCHMDEALNLYFHSKNPYKFFLFLFMNFKHKLLYINTLQFTLQQAVHFIGTYLS